MEVCHESSINHKEYRKAYSFLIYASHADNRIYIWNLGQIYICNLGQKSTFEMQFTLQTKKEQATQDTHVVSGDLPTCPPTLTLPRAIDTQVNMEDDVDMKDDTQVDMEDNDESSGPLWEEEQQRDAPKPRDDTPRSPVEESGIGSREIPPREEDDDPPGDDDDDDFCTFRFLVSLTIWGFCMYNFILG